MEMTKNQRKINWYRCPLPRETLAVLNQRSDFWGLLQTLGHLGLLAATGAGLGMRRSTWPCRGCY